MVSAIKFSTLYATCIMCIGTILFHAIPDVLLKIFNASDTMLKVGVPALRIISLSFPAAAICIAISGAFQAVGKSIYSLVVSVIRQLVFLVPIALVLAYIGRDTGSHNLVWWAFPIAELSSIIVTAVCFRRMKRTVLSQVPDGAPHI